MTPITSFAGKHVALFGLGTSGLDAARALLAGGATVAAWDDKEASRDKAAAADIAIVDLHEADWSTFEAFVLAPGVPLTHPKPHWTVDLAHAAGVAIIGDIELFCRERAAIAPNARFVAITGTNGKSTTTALTAHLFREFGYEVAVGGNIGTPVLQLPPPSENRVHVVECSSFQIDLAPSIQPTAGVLMNLTPDHLDRHGTMANYAAVKSRLVTHSGNAIVSVDDPDSAAIAQAIAIEGRVVETISVAGNMVAQGITLAGTVLMRHRDMQATPVADLAGIASLRGAHNAQNAAAAILALGEDAADLDQLQAALRSFPGLAHRMEQIAAQDGVIFVNDSKATNADAAEKALLAFPRVHWIIGGKAKDGGIEAGLRSGDLLRPWPEEGNRRIIGTLASLHFAPTETAAAALRREGTDPMRIHVTGNTAIDALHAILAQDRTGVDDPLAPLLERFAGQRIAVVTCHRRENAGTGVARIAEALARIAARSDVALVCPLHPNPAIRDVISARLGRLPNVALIEPLPYPDFVRLLSAAHLVLSDSGGVQEEAPALGKPVLVLRDTTERGEGVAAGTARLVGTDTDRIVAETFALLDDPAAYAAMARSHLPFGDGRAAPRIVAALAQEIERGVEEALP